VKVVFLSTGRGLRPPFINELRANLDLQDCDIVCLVSWQRPRAPLPVNRHLVVGPNLRIAGTLATVQRVQRRPDLLALNAQKAQSRNQSDPGPAPAGNHSTHLTHLPVYHPRRLRQAIAWRLRRLRRSALSSGRLIEIRTHPRFRKARNQMTPGVSLGFATSCLRARKVHEMTRDADIVIALDTASHRGAWTLARRVPGPDVVIGIPAAQRVLAQRDTSTSG
jgi:hypothetical protein